MLNTNSEATSVINSATDILGKGADYYKEQCEG